MRKLPRALLVLGIVGVCLAMSAPDARARGACVKEIIKFCKGIKPGQGRIAICLYAHQSSLSPECRQQAKKDFRKWMQVSSDCYFDVKRFCTGIKPGGGRIVACLLKHEGELKNEACKAEVTKAREGLQSLLPGVCLPDARKFCKDVKPGEGRVRNCLKEHRAELKPACRRKVDRWK